MTNPDRATVTLVFAPLEAADVQYAVEGDSVDEIVQRLYDACQLHGDIVVEPFAGEGATFRNVTQVFAQGLNNTFDDIDATWEDSGRIVIRSR